MTTQEAYRLLGLSAQASPDDVKRAYRRKALESHPDRFQDPRDKAFHQRKFLDIRDAYAHLRSENVLELPEESVVVPEFGDHLAGRSFAPRETQEVGNAEKLGLQVPFRVDAVVTWGLALPAAVALLIYSVKLLITMIQGGNP